MSVKKLITAGFIAMSMMAGSAFASLTIVNNTDNDSTSIVNKGSCSTILGDSGVTHAHSTNTVSDIKIKLACGCTIYSKNNPKCTDCSAVIFMTNNCSGPSIGSVLFDISTGVKSITVTDQKYMLSGSGFNAQIDPRS